MQVPADQSTEHLSGEPAWASTDIDRAPWARSPHQMHTAPTSAAGTVALKGSSEVLRLRAFHHDP